MKKKLRVGIDVGGTFTDAVIIDNETYDIVAQAKIPTTHSHKNGVAQGIMDILYKLIHENDIDPKDIVFIAHGTTQATNALLEGDVAKVGVLAMSTGIDSISAKNETNPGDIELSNGKFLHVKHKFIDTKNISDEIIDECIADLTNDGSEVIVASESYSVDDPTNELRVINRAIEKGLYSTGGHEISELYGLRVRTRTAVVNASLVPKMIETANMTENAIKSVDIDSELMIMRCDGGVMNINEVRKRPILTMLSGLAAGVAGTLMYEKISDGIFLEVGGTSIDISVIKNGKVMLKNAEVGNHKTYVNSLDVRTLAIAGGSMIQVRDKKIIDVGPRSAHIAGLPYESFTDTFALKNPVLQYISPCEGDEENYISIKCDKENIALTLAGAANILGYIPENDYAYGNLESSKIAWKILAEELGISVEECCRQVMDIALDKLCIVLYRMVEDYDLNKNFTVLVGGGGSASVITEALAEREGFNFVIAKNAPYISTIGVALAMVREQIERTIISPSKEDIEKIRMDVIDKIIQSGANEETVDITIEIDATKNILRAIAIGSTELRTKDLTEHILTKDELHEIALTSLSAETKGDVKLVADNGRWSVFQSETLEKKLLGLWKKKGNRTAVLDREGVVRHNGKNEEVRVFNKGELHSTFSDFIDSLTKYSDANAIIPKIFLFYNEKMLDLCGMQSKQQLMTTVELEMEFLESSQSFIGVAYN